MIIRSIILSILLYSQVVFCQSKPDYLEFTRDTSEMLKAIAVLKKTKTYNFIPLSKDIDKTHRDSIRKMNDSIENLRIEYLNQRSIATHILYSELSYYPRLANYEKELIEPLWYDFTHIKANKPKIAKLLSLFKLPAEIKDSILHDETVPDYVKAKLGDKAKELKIIDSFKKGAYNQQSVLFDKHIHYAELLIYIGSTNCMDEIFNAMQTTVYYEKDYWENDIKIKNSWSLAFNMLFVLNKYYPLRIFQQTPESYASKKLGFNELQTYKYCEPYYNKIEEAVWYLFEKKIKIKAYFLSNKTIIE